LANVQLRTGKWWGRVLVAAIAIAIFGGGFLTGRTQAATLAPGSYEDPLVSQSYLEQFVELVVVELASGQRLEGGAGTQIIVRSGPARAVASSSGGMCDVTSGRDLTSNERVSANHLLLVPRNDGRGILAEGKVWALVRGVYTIK